MHPPTGLFAAFHLAALVPLLPPAAAGAAAVYLLLPRPKPYPAWAGGALAVLALVLAGFLVVPLFHLTPEVVLFYCFSAIAVLSGGLLVTQHHPARAALSFTLVIMAVCGLFALLAAPFLMAATIIVYAGAIIVTFLFVLMLASQAGITDADSRSREPALAAVTGFVLLAAVLYALHVTYVENPTVKLVDELIAKLDEAKRDAPPNDQTKFDEHLAKMTEPVKARLNEYDLKNAEYPAWLRNVRDELYADNSVGTDDDRAKTFARLEGTLYRTRQQQAWLQPGVLLRVSNLSGPPANQDPNQFRYGRDGAPLLPADNAAYLGRSLFTEYLLAVELAGVLLLVAVVGAIAIAQRAAATDVAEEPS